MNGYLTLAPEAREPAPQLGDLVGIEILLEEKIGASGDAWRIKTPAEEKWLAVGSLTLSTDTLRTTLSDGSRIKLLGEALVHQPGPLATAEFSVVHQPSGREVVVVAKELSAEVAAPAEGEKKEASWYLPPVAFGGWNYFLLALLLAILIALATLAVRRFGQKIKARRKLNCRDRALQSLQSLQKFARSKKALQQQEWKRFSFELAGIIRKYSDENFHLDSSDMTDREFLAELRLNGKARPLVDSLAEILSTIDEVRYGRKGLEATDVPGLLLEAKKFFEQAYQPNEGEEKK